MWLELLHVLCSHVAGKSNKHHAHKTRHLMHTHMELFIFLGIGARAKSRIPLHSRLYTHQALIQLPLHDA